MRTLFLCSIEKLAARYSWQLEQWNTDVYKKRGINYQVIYGDDLTGDQIVTGSVLDAHGRSYFSLTQIANLVKLMREGKITSEDVIFFEDMFTPGIESLAYIMNQVKPEYRPRIYARVLAQSVDPDDFVNREGMFNWMRQFEMMCDSFVTGWMVANEELVAHMRTAGFKAPIYVTGLPFGKKEVQDRVPNRVPLADRTRRVAFAARWDDEKNPDFYMDLAESVYKDDPSIEFAIFCGHKTLKSNNQKYVDRALSLETSGTANFKVYTGLDKNTYYSLLADSMVLFNCALQDFWSNTSSEADALGTFTLFPAYRSFPETFANNSSHLYVPWSLDDAKQKLLSTFSNLGACQIGALSDYADGCVDRTLDIMEGKGEHLARNTLDYRKYVTVPKYTW